MLSNDVDELYFPGHIHISRALLQREIFKTISDPATDKNEIYYFNGQIYERGEEKIRTEAQQTYLTQWNEMASRCEEFINSAQGTEGQIAYVAKLWGRLKNALHRGPTVNDINEVLADIRRVTYIGKGEMNPSSHVPFLNGLLNLKTRRLEQFNPELFYTWQIQANFLEQHTTLNDTPKFRYYLNSVYFERDIPAVLSHMGYALQPGFKRHKVLAVFGRERIGKGTTARILKLLNPRGYGSISWEKLLISDNRFVFQSVLGKNLLVDPEMRRTYPKGHKPDYANFNKLFGGDVVDLERKGRDPIDHVSMAKGLFIGNLPAPSLDNAAAIARFQVVQTRNKRDSAEIPEIEKDIISTERDFIARLLIQCFWGLEERGYIFPGELENESNQEFWNLLADPVTNFIEEMTDWSEGSVIEVDEAYKAFMNWCEGRGIPTPARQTFTSRFALVYEKRKIGARGSRHYAFNNCIVISQVEIMPPTPQSKLDTEGSTSNPLKNGGLRNKFKRVQLRLHDINYFENFKYYTCKEIAPKLDTRFLPAKSLENTDSPDMKNGVQPSKGISDSSLDLFKEAYNMFNFFEPPDVRIVTRETDNVKRWLHYVKKLSEDQAEETVKSWISRGLVKEIYGQLVALKEDPS
ncbi:MAG: primase-like DNA-binding domain-containing protein [Candidatus Micrarchaeaceae archaeon]